MMNRRTFLQAITFGLLYRTASAKSLDMEVKGQPAAPNMDKMKRRWRVEDIETKVRQAYVSWRTARAGELNTPDLRKNLRDCLSELMSEFGAQSLLYRFEVKCDEENNSPEVLNRNDIVADVWYSAFVDGKPVSFGIHLSRETV